MKRDTKTKYYQDYFALHQYVMRIKKTQEQYYWYKTKKALRTKDGRLYVHTNTFSLPVSVRLRIQAVSKNLPSSRDNVKEEREKYLHLVKIKKLIVDLEREY